MHTEIQKLIQRPDFAGDKRFDAVFWQAVRLTDVLRSREIPDQIVEKINEQIITINAFPGQSREITRMLRKFVSTTITLLEKELKLVPKNYYQNQWMAIGMATFGIPLGVVFGTSLGNMAFLGIGLPLGLAIGMALGSVMDKKAAAEGRQLDLDLK